MVQEVLASPLSLFSSLFASDMGHVLRYFLFLENELLKCYIVHFFVWNQCLGKCRNDQSLQFLVSVPPLSVYLITNSDEEETAAEATKSHVKGRVHIVFFLYQQDYICRSIQRDVICGHRVSFPSVLCIKAVKKYGLRMTRECTVHLFLSACKTGKDFAVEDSRYFWTEKRCKVYLQFILCLIFKTN